MGDLKSFVKERWPWILGGLVGLYLVFKYMGGSSANNSGSSMASYLASQNQAASQQAIANAQIQAQREMQAADIALKRDTLNAQIGASNTTAQVQFLQAQGVAAGQVAGAAANIVGALNQPAIAAMNAAAYENAAALSGAAGVAQAGYIAQSTNIRSASAAVTAVGDAVGRSAQSLGQQVDATGKVAQSGFTSYAANTQANNQSSMNWANLGMAALSLMAL